MGTDYRVICPECKVGTDAGFYRKVFGNALDSQKCESVMKFIATHIINCGEVQFIPDDCGDDRYGWKEQPPHRMRHEKIHQDIPTNMGAGV
jgi:hypothetical protein